MGLGKTIQVVALLAQLRQWDREDRSAAAFECGDADPLCTRATSAALLTARATDGTALAEDGVLIQAALRAAAKAGMSVSLAAPAVAAVRAASSAAAGSLAAKLAALECGGAPLLGEEDSGNEADGDGDEGDGEEEGEGGDGPSRRRRAAPVASAARRATSPHPAPAADLQNTSMRGSSGPHLVLAPTSTLANWVRELGKWCPELRVRVRGDGWW